jgi:hypothetical protein
MILGSSPWFGFASMILAILVLYALAVTSDYKETA